MPQIYKREEMLSVSKIRKMIPGKNGGPCSRQHVYNLMDEGKIKPFFMFSGCRHAPRLAVENYLHLCEIDPAA